MTIYKQAAEWIGQQCSSSATMPASAVVLGSGLNNATQGFNITERIPYSAIPNFPKQSAAVVEGHKGELALAQSASGQWVWLLQGRVHFYEGYSAEQVVFPIRLLQALGVEKVVLTNAAGGITPGFKVGDLMLITDHLNLTGCNPLVGPNDETIGPRFVDMTAAYDALWQEQAVAVAQQYGITLQQGVYAGLLGPSYETPAEIKMLATLGANAVGMSTVMEAIAARHAGLKVLGISMISNLAAGLSGQALSHAEVLDVGQQSAVKLGQLLQLLL